MLAWRDNRLNANGDTQARRILFIAGMTDHSQLSYDGLNRLTKVVAPVAESFTLDQASNIDLRAGPSQDFGYDAANRITGLDGNNSYYQWTNADQLSVRGADSFHYDALDRLKDSTVAGTTRTYAYNGDGLLKSRTQGSTTQFLWDPSTSPSRELKQGSDNIVYGLGPLYVVKGDGSTLTFARDGGKSVRAEINSAGAVTALFRYRAYGQIAQSTGTPTPSYLGYAGQLFDPSGLYYMRARWYDPVIGRFITSDPIDGDPIAPIGLNGYAYAALNPSRYDDPAGTCAAHPVIAFLCMLAQRASALFQRVVPSIQRAAPAAQRVEQAAEPVAKTAYAIAQEGGPNAGLIANYMSRSAAQIARAVTSLERQAERHLQKVSAPQEAVSGFENLAMEEQQGLLQYWAKEAARYQTQADVLRGLLDEIGGP
jgi:RHS repeat-associated protein